MVGSRTHDEGPAVRSPLRLLLVGGEPGVRGRVAALIRRTLGPVQLDLASAGPQALGALAAGRHDLRLVCVAHDTLDLLPEALSGAGHPALLAIVERRDPQLERRLTAAGVREVIARAELEARLPRALREVLAASERPPHRIRRDPADDPGAQRRALRAAGQAIWHWDLAADRVQLSADFAELRGTPGGPAELPTEAFFELVHPRDRLRLRAMLDAHLGAAGTGARCDHRLRRGDGSWRWVQTSALSETGEDGRVRGLTGASCDIESAHTSAAARERDALRDPLTELPSRALLIDRAGQLIRRAARDPGCAPAILFVDIDHFHRVEDEYGRGVGDGLLRAVGRRLSGLLRPGDTAARVGDDEFGVLLDGAGGDPGARIVARRMLSALAKPVVLDGRRMLVSATIGIALAGPEIADGELLLERAEAAMYQAKRTARGGAEGFQSAYPEVGPRRASREAELRQLIERSGLCIHYQPIVDLHTGAVRALEAFARWPGDGDVPSPLEFVPLAEDMGLIGPLCRQVMTGALGTLSRWRGAGLIGDGVSMSVNVSARQLEDPHLPGLVRTALASGGVPAQVLRLDVAERSLGEDAPLAGRWLTEVGATGVALHLDDFGTGASSLAALARLPVAALKVDRSLVAGLTETPQIAEPVVRSTIALAGSLGVLTIAEGVEEDAQLRILRELGCDCGQGYLFSRPLDAMAMEGVLAGWAAEPATV